MKILVDADACPVKNEVLRVAKQLDIQVIMFIDTSHQIHDGYSDVVMVDKGRDSVDIALINRTSRGDIVVTQDYGVATMALAKGAYGINQNGFLYTEENIDRLLFERHLSQEMRRSGRKGSKIKKRGKEENERFEQMLLKICQDIIKGPE